MNKKIKQTKIKKECISDSAREYEAYEKMKQRGQS